MSGSGGYYKYRCKYWLTYNCSNWVWVNNAPCASCLADGRDNEMTMMPGPLRISREVYVPQLEDGSLHYHVMEVIAASEFDSGWAVKDMPNVDQRNLENGFKGLSDGMGWMGSGGNLD